LIGALFVVRVKGEPGARTAIYMPTEPLVEILQSLSTGLFLACAFLYGCSFVIDRFVRPRLRDALPAAPGNPIRTAVIGLSVAALGATVAFAPTPALIATLPEELTFEFSTAFYAFEAQTIAFWMVMGFVAAAATGFALASMTHWLLSSIRRRKDASSQ
jgi:hypothetical protein